MAAWWARQLTGNVVAVNVGAAQQGFRLNTWTFPQGVTITLGYTAGSGEGGDSAELPDLASVSNNLGQSINLGNGLRPF